MSSARSVTVYTCSGVAPAPPVVEPSAEAQPSPAGSTARSMPVPRWVVAWAGRLTARASEVAPITTAMARTCLMRAGMADPSLSYAEGARVSGEGCAREGAEGIRPGAR